MNQYFQLFEESGKVYIQIVPAMDGGKELDIKEVQAYLEQLGYKSYDLRELNQAMTQETAGTPIYVGEWNGFHEREKMKLSVSSDDMLVYARFYAPSTKGETMDDSEILRDLQAFGVKIGIQQEVLRELNLRREYCTDYLVARGEPPKNGKDGKVIYLFNINPNLRPKRNEDGSVDYHQLNTINPVKPGQCIARLQKEIPGEAGRTVFGKNIPPRQVKRAALAFSNNIEVSEDGTELYSSVTGHVKLMEGKIFVENTFEVARDVDNETGDVHFDGNVLIHGNVKSGFAVESKGDIVVEGVVEAAELTAGGQIIVKRGVHGMGRGVLRADGNIITKFIENASVTSNGYVETESILHSAVSARTDVRVGGKHGFIAGGVTKAGNMIEAKNIGSEMGANTRVEVGTDPEIKERYLQLQQDIMRVNKEMKQIRPVLEQYTKLVAEGKQMDPEKTRQIQLLARTFKGKTQQIQYMHEEFDNLYAYMSGSDNARVKVNGTIYPGVWVRVSDKGMSVKSTYSHSQIVQDGGEVVIRPM